MMSNGVGKERRSLSLRIAAAAVIHHKQLPLILFVLFYLKKSIYKRTPRRMRQRERQSKT